MQLATSQRSLSASMPHPVALKGAANAYLTNPRYGTYRLRSEIAQAAVEAATVEARQRLRLNEGGER